MKAAYSSVGRFSNEPIAHAVDPLNPLWHGKPGRSRQLGACGAVVARITNADFDELLERPCPECLKRDARQGLAEIREKHRDLLASRA